MKKLISVLLMVAFLTGSFPAVFATENLDVSFDIYEKSTEKAVILNSTVATSDYDLYIAAYKGKKMVAVQKVDMELYRGYNKISTGLNWDDVDKDEVKILAWEEGMKIHSAKYEYEVLRPATSLLSPFVVTNNTAIAYKNGTAYMLNGIYDDRENRIIVYNEKGYDGQHPENLAPDDVILIAEPDENGEVSYIEYIETTKWEGVVSSTLYTNIATVGAYDPYAEPKFSLANAYYWEDGVKFSGEERVIACGNVDVNPFIGKSITAYIGENPVTGKDTAYAVYGKTANNNSLKISASQLVDSGDKYWDVEDVIGYREVDSSKICDISLAYDAEVYVNYEKESGINTTEKIAYTMIYNGGTVEFISNDADDEYEVILISSYDGESVIEKVQEDDGTYYFTCYVGGTPSEIDTTDEDTLNVVYKDGKSATVADIAANDTVNYAQIAKGFDIYYVSSATVEGTVESYDSEMNVVTIDGADYEISLASGLNAAKLAGVTGTFFLNVDGQIAHVELERVVPNYALVLASYSAVSGVEYSDYLQVLQADGTLAEYKLSDNASVISSDYEVMTYDVKEYFDALLTGTKSGSVANFATVEDVMSNTDLMVKLTISNNKITKVKLLEDYSKSATATDTFDTETMSAGKIDFDEGAVIFSVKEISGVITAEDVAISTTEDFFSDGEEIGGELIAYDMNYITERFCVAVGFGLANHPEENEDEVTGTEITALVLASYTAQSGVNCYDYLQIMQSDGTLIEYPISENAGVYRADGYVVSEYVKHYFDEMLSGTKSGSFAKFATADDVQSNANLMVKLTISNDKITKVRLIEGGSMDASTTDKFDAVTMSIGELEFDADAVIFSVKQTAGVIEAEDVVVDTVADFFTDGEEIGGTLIAWGMDKETGIFPVAVGFGLANHPEENEDDFAGTESTALVLASYTAESGVNCYDYLQVMQSDGTLIEYPISKDARIYGINGYVVSENVKVFFDSKLSGYKMSSSANFATVEDVMSNTDLMVKLTISNNKITKVKLLESHSVTASATEKFDEVSMTVGNIAISEDTVIFSVKQRSGVIDAEDIVICKSNDLFTDGEEINGMLKAYDMDEETGVFPIAVGFGIKKTINPGTSIFVVTSKKITSIDDCEAYIFTGIQEGEEKIVTVYNVDSDYIVDPYDVEKGDILLLQEANSEGFVSEIYELFDYSENEVTASNAKEADAIYSGFGKVSASSTNRFAVSSALINDATDEEILSSGEEIAYRASATYTLLDYTENSKNPEVSIETGNKRLFDVEMYESYAYVRFVDDKLSEVVVYRVAEIE